MAVFVVGMAVAQWRIGGRPPLALVWLVMMVMHVRNVRRIPELETQGVNGLGSGRVASATRDVISRSASLSAEQVGDTSAVGSVSLRGCRFAVEADACVSLTLPVASNSKRPLSSRSGDRRDATDASIAVRVAAG